MLSFILLLSLISTMSMLARASGGGILKIYGWAGGLPEILFGFFFGLTAYFWAFDHFSHHAFAVGFLAWIWSWQWMETGLDTAFHMGLDEEDVKTGKAKDLLEVVVKPLCAALEQPLGGQFYCWVLMGLKGLLICFPVGWAALLAFPLWPTCYYFGNRVVPRLWPTVDGEMVAEFLSGGVAGFLIWLSI